MTLRLYKGFSSFEFQKSKTFSLSNVEIVKLDLLNHIFTQRGSRVRMPTFGTMIPEMVFEPLDDDTLSTIEEELRAVFDFDPRVEVVDMVVVPKYDENSIYASARLFYVELDVVDNFDLNIKFEQ